MDNAIGDILNFFTDSSKSVGSKVGTIMITIFLLFAIDIIGSFTYNFQVNNKLNQLEKIEQLKEKYQSNQHKLALLKKTESSILKRQHYTDFVSSLFGSNDQRTAEKMTQNNTATPSNSILNRNLMIISSNYSLVIILPFLLLMPLFAMYQKTLTNDFVFGWFLALILMASTITVITIIAYMFPVLDESRPYLNYFLNVGIHTIFLFLLILLFKRKEYN